MSSETSTTSGRAGIGHDSASRQVAIARLLIGLIQGVALWALYRTQDISHGGRLLWPATQPLLFGPLVLITAFLPIIMLAGVGRLRFRTLAIWGVGAGMALGLLALHDVARASTPHDGPLGSFVILPFSAVALFITHHLIVPADRERRWIAPFHAYFDAAWMAGVQLALSIGFTGAFWLLLGLGAALFNVIGLSFLGDLIQEAWFAFPLTGLVFATAVQLTDVREGLIRGVRSVALMLLSWLLLVLTVLVAGFLAALPFTGLDGLWETGSATALVLSAAGALIILINTAYQDGRPDNLPPVALRVAVRVASVLLTPLVVIAVWGLSLRIGQHGLTPDRIIAAACALVGAAYAVGYGAAALIPFARRGSPWMKALEPTNIAVAVLTVAVILALFSPLADPARLSVADQVKRLESGKVAADKFDYQFLASRSGKAGEQALKQLKRSTNPDIARRATDLTIQFVKPEPENPQPVIQVRPGSRALPAAFFENIPSGDARQSCRSDLPCVASMQDMDGDHQDDIVLALGETITLFTEDPKSGTYHAIGTYISNVCDGSAGDARAVLRRGPLKTMATSHWPDLDVGEGRTARFTPYPADCSSAATSDAAVVQNPAEGITPVSR